MANAIAIPFSLWFSLFVLSCRFLENWTKLGSPGDTPSVINLNLKTKNTAFLQQQKTAYWRVLISVIYFCHNLLAREKLIGITLHHCSLHIVIFTNLRHRCNYHSHCKKLYLYIIPNIDHQTRKSENIKKKFSTLIRNISVCTHQWSKYERGVRALRQGLFQRSDIYKKKKNITRSTSSLCFERSKISITSNHIYSNVLTPVCKNRITFAIEGATNEKAIKKYTEFR